LHEPYVQAQAMQILSTMSMPIGKVNATNKSATHGTGHIRSSSFNEGPLYPNRAKCTKSGRLHEI
jgi:hypothetical protein